MPNPFESLFPAIGNTGDLTSALPKKIYAPQKKVKVGKAASKMPKPAQTCPERLHPSQPKQKAIPTLGDITSFIDKRKTLLIIVIIILLLLAVVIVAVRQEQQRKTLKHIRSKLRRLRA